MNTLRLRNKAKRTMRRKAKPWALAYVQYLKERTELDRQFRNVSIVQAWKQK